MKNSNAPAASSNFLDFVEHSQKSWSRKLRRFLPSRRNGSGDRRKLWKPHALQPSVLIFTILICWALILTLQLLLTKSQRESGLIFAPTINDLPLSRTFWHQYLPTILAILFSIFWSWIDLETKRLEPFFQLSKDEGAAGKDSLLLHYPFDFLPFVPLAAFRNRHWAVFWASTAVVIVTWGLVPTQAGIFAVSTVTRAFPSSFAVSDSYLPAAHQDTGLSLRFAQSVYGIVTLNEVLPPYMSHTYALAPFEATNEEAGERRSQDWTSPTTLYSLDLKCEEAKYNDTYSIKDCNTEGINPNQTMKDSDPNYPLSGRKEFSAMYVGFYNIGFADSYLSTTCAAALNHTFYVGFTRNKKNQSDQPSKAAAVFCQPQYYAQDVNATVHAASRRPKEIVSLGPKREIPPDLFNTTLFEAQLNSQATNKEVRGALPMMVSFPSYAEFFAHTNLTVQGSGGELHFMAALAVLARSQSLENLEDYLDVKVLGESYEAAYRLMFSRAMAQVLDQNFSSARPAVGQRQVTSQAVIFVPVFTFIVEGLLGLVSICALALLYLTMTRKVNLRSDPSTIASIMALVADEQPLLSAFESLDARPMEDIDSAVGLKRYKLATNDLQDGIIELDKSTSIATESRISTAQSIARPIRPVEFRWFVAVPFVTLHVALAIVLVVLFTKNRRDGLPLPSKNKFAQNIVENYIPTAIATLIEPMWILINRLLCLLQPLEELRKGTAPAKRSIDLDYASLPPQLVVFKALRAKHYILAAVCFMALLANILAVAFAGIFNQDLHNVSTTSTFETVLQPKFVAINGSVGPGRLGASSGAWSGGDGNDHFLIAESNSTRGTELPAWTDNRMLYLPFKIETFSGTDRILYTARTNAVGAKLDCAPLAAGTNFTGRFSKGSDGSVSVKGQTQDFVFHTNVTAASGSSVICAGSASVRAGMITSGSGDTPYQCQEGPVAVEFVIPLSARTNATTEETEACAGLIGLGWARNPAGSCGPSLNRTLSDSDSFFVRCSPRLVVGEATVLVSPNGQLQQPVKDLEVSEHLSAQDLERYLSNDIINLIGQSNQFLFPTGIDDSMPWHNDTFASQYINHFILARNGTRLLDPYKPPPNFDDVEEPLRAVYSYLFAIWLGANKEKLLVPYETAPIPTIQGWKIMRVERLFLSKPMTAVAEGILLCYAIVALLVYFRCPGEYLARLPTSIASIMALFAASAAVQDVKGTSQMSKKERARHLEELGARYGYGSYVGGDGRVHIGIEKVPFVRIRATSTWFGKTMNSF